MLIETHNTSTTIAEAAQAKAEARLLLEENGLLRQALVDAQSAIGAGEVIQAYAIIVAALLGEKK